MPALKSVLCHGSLEMMFTRREMIVGLLVGGATMAVATGIGGSERVTAGTGERDLVRNGSFEFDDQGAAITGWTIFVVESGGT